MRVQLRYLFLKQVCLVKSGMCEEQRGQAGLLLSTPALVSAQRVLFRTVCLVTIRAHGQKVVCVVLNLADAVGLVRREQIVISLFA